MFAHLNHTIGILLDSLNQDNNFNPPRVKILFGKSFSLLHHSKTSKNSLKIENTHPIEMHFWENFRNQLLHNVLSLFWFYQFVICRTNEFL